MQVPPCIRVTVYQVPVQSRWYVFLKQKKHNVVFTFLAHYSRYLDFRRVSMFVLLQQDIAKMYVL